MVSSNLGGALKHLRDAFSEAGIETPELDARLLLEWVTGADRLAVLKTPERIVSEEEAEKLQDALTRRLTGEPVHRIIGRRGFYGLEFELSPETLEPRPDTECLVELVLKRLKGREEKTLSLLDLGTGTGIIAISLLANLPGARAVATDISSGALETCGKNAAANGVHSRLTCFQSNWFESVEGEFDVIVSNPPYISTHIISGLSREVRGFDPIVALDGDADGLEAYRALALGAQAHLADEGFVALEIGHDQRASVKRIFEKSGFELAEFARDLGGNDRALLFTKMGRSATAKIPLGIRRQRGYLGIVERSKRPFESSFRFGQAGRAAFISTGCPKILCIGPAFRGGGLRGKCVVHRTGERPKCLNPTKRDIDEAAAEQSEPAHAQPRPWRRQQRRWKQRRRRE